MRDCSSCRGVCRVPTACELPEPAMPRRSFLPTTSEGWGRLIGAVLGAAGAFFVAGAVGRHLNLF
jgi:hypothetical protein